MNASYTRLIALVVILSSNSSFANQKLWNQALADDWLAIKSFLEISETPREDLEWIPDDSHASIRDLLLDCRRNIKTAHPKLYEVLFTANGLIPWLAAEDNADIDNFLATAKIQEMFDCRIKDEERKQEYSQKLFRGYRKLLSNTFPPDELAELNAIYQDSDFQLLINRCEQMPTYVTVPREFRLDSERFKVLNSLVSRLEVILVEGLFITSDLTQAQYPMAFYSVSEMLSGFSDDRIRALTQKLASPVYCREIIKRSSVLRDLGEPIS